MTKRKASPKEKAHHTVYKVVRRHGKVLKSAIVGWGKWRRFKKLEKVYAVGKFTPGMTLAFDSLLNAESWVCSLTAGVDIPKSFEIWECVTTSFTGIEYIGNVEGATAKAFEAMWDNRSRFFNKSWILNAVGWYTGRLTNGVDEVHGVKFGKEVVPVSRVGIGWIKCANIKLISRVVQQEEPHVSDLGNN